MKFNQVKGVGYSLKDVDSFFDRQRTVWNTSELDATDFRFVQFPKEKLGYNVDQVDAALELMRIDAILKKKQDVIVAVGVDGYRGGLRKMLSLITGDVRNASDTMRFQDSKSDETGYSKKDVDKFVKKILDSLDNGHDNIKIPDLKNIGFSKSSKPKGGYSILEVDDFIEDLIDYIRAKTL
jgi:DivIVA domain-containing protein